MKRVRLHINAAAIMLVIFGAGITPSFALAQATSQISGPELLSSITRCRSIVSDSERLLCFDAAAGSLAAAGDVAVVRRDDVQQDQRRLFGFNVAISNPFNPNGRADEIQSISAMMTNARDLGRGEWIITLDDGSIWRKTDSVVPIFSTRRENSVTVRRAALGSYMMKVGDTPPFRVKRE
nr:hypothetical protein [uncultured Brevundimonas sp.]